MYRSIESITSRHKIIKQKNPLTERNQEVSFKIWNPAIANLTLVALASSAPEMMLIIIETIQNLVKNEKIDHPDVENLGLSLIIGSSAVKTMLNTALCIVATRRDYD